MMASITTKPSIQKPKRASSVAYIAVGANIDPKKNIILALDALARVVKIQAISTFYRSPPVVRREQSMFLNGVFQIETAIQPRELKFDVLRPIESNLGRIRTNDTHAPRPIDLDLILYGNQVIGEADLSIPALDIYARSFVAIPLLELAPDLIIPGSGKRLFDLSIVRQKNSLKVLFEFTQLLKQRIEQ